MIIKDKKGVEYHISMEDYQRLIVSQGNAHKFAVVEDDAPIEVKQLRIKKETNKK